MSLHPASTKAKLCDFKRFFLLKLTVKVLYFQVTLLSLLVVPEHDCHRDPDILEIHHEVPRTLDRDKLEQLSISPESSKCITMKVLIFRPSQIIIPGHPDDGDVELESPGAPGQVGVPHQHHALQLGAPPVVEVEVAGLDQDLVHVGVDGNLEGEQLERVHHIPQVTVLKVFR